MQNGYKLKCKVTNHLVSIHLEPTRILPRSYGIAKVFFKIQRGYRKSESSTFWARLLGITNLTQSIHQRVPLRIFHSLRQRHSENFLERA